MKLNVHKNISDKYSMQEILKIENYKLRKKRINTNNSKNKRFG